MRAILNLILIVAAVKSEALNQTETIIQHRLLEEAPVERTPQDERFFFGTFLPLPNFPIPCRTRGNCCRGQCTATATTCAAGAAIGAVCLPAPPGAATGATECRTTAICGACDSFTCNVNTACNTATGLVCAIP